MKIFSARLAAFSAAPTGNPHRQPAGQQDKIMNDNVIEFRKRTAVAVYVHEDAERYTLEIDFKPNPPDLPDTSELKTEGLGITLVCWKNGDKPSVGIWTGRGEHGFEDESVGSFRNWVEFALGRRSLAEYEAKVMEGWEFPHT
jgi:hypothetical protein